MQSLEWQMPIFPLMVGAKGRGDCGSTSQYGRTDPSSCLPMSRGQTVSFSDAAVRRRVNELHLPDGCVSVLTTATYSFLITTDKQNRELFQFLSQTGPEPL